MSSVCVFFGVLAFSDSAARAALVPFSEDAPSTAPSGGLWAPPAAGCDELA